MTDSAKDPACWYYSLPWEGDYRVLDAVPIGKNRELAFAYSVEWDQFALIEITSPKTARSRHWLYFERADDEDIWTALVDFACGELPWENVVTTDPAPDDPAYAVHREVLIGEKNYLGLAYSNDDDLFALSHRTSNATHIIPIEVEYDNYALQNALERFATGEYPLLGEYIDIYNSRIVNLPTQRDFD